MPDYLPVALHNFQPQDFPHSWKKSMYGTTIQWADNPDDSPILPTKSITLVQEFIVTLLYYAISVDLNMCRPWIHRLPAFYCHSAHL